MAKVKCSNCKNEHEMSKPNLPRLREGKNAERFNCPDCGAPIKLIVLPPEFLDGGLDDEDVFE